MKLIIFVYEEWIETLSWEFNWASIMYPRNFWKSFFYDNI